MTEELLQCTYNSIRYSNDMKMKYVWMTAKYICGCRPLIVRIYSFCATYEILLFIICHCCTVSHVNAIVLV